MTSQVIFLLLVRQLIHS